MDGHLQSEARLARSERSRPKRYDWAELMRGVFETDVLRCGSRRKRIALITDLYAVRRFLRQLGLPSEPPARSPSQMSSAL